MKEENEKHPRFECSVASKQHPFNFQSSPLESEGDSHRQGCKDQNQVRSFFSRGLGCCALENTQPALPVYKEVKDKTQASWTTGLDSIPSPLWYSKGAPKRSEFLEHRGNSAFTPPSLWKSLVSWELGCALKGHSEVCLETASLNLLHDPGEWGL